MIRHIVMWKLKESAEGADKATNAAKVKAWLDTCHGLVPGMGIFEVAVATPGLEATCDVVLYAEFDDKAALDAYQSHPTHAALMPKISAVRSERHCMDFVA
ncbi:MAG TPA: Dabb family protein [Myxococcales bacterium]